MEHISNPFKPILAEEYDYPLDSAGGYFANISDISDFFSPNETDEDFDPYEIYSDETDLRSDPQFFLVMRFCSQKQVGRKTIQNPFGKARSIRYRLHGGRWGRKFTGKVKNFLNF